MEALLKEIKIDLMQIHSKTERVIPQDEHGRVENLPITLIFGRDCNRLTDEVLKQLHARPSRSITAICGSYEAAEAYKTIGRTRVLAELTEIDLIDTLCDEKDTIVLDCIMTKEVFERVWNKYQSSKMIICEKWNTNFPLKHLSDVAQMILIPDGVGQHRNFKMVMNKYIHPRLHPNLKADYQNATYDNVPVHIDSKDLCLRLQTL